MISSARFHPQFRELLNSPFHGAARAQINDVFGRMHDPNGKFARHFQGAGFHQRLFEISCAAYLEEANAIGSRTFEAPDFVVSIRGQDIAIEAVTSNQPDDASADISVARMLHLSQTELEERVSVEFPKRIAASLRKKVDQHYETLPHVSGKPLVLMVAPFFEPGASFSIDDSLVPLLYGAPPGNGSSRSFFGHSESNAISAVVYCNGFSVSKFWRLADHSEFDGFAVRSGHCYNYLENGELAPGPYEFRVGSPEAPTETWSEGVTIFENPCARHSLPPGILPATSTFAVEDGYLTRTVNGFHPVTSAMICYRST